ncbi:unnamed protein product [Absidia cylindrospora]
MMIPSISSAFVLLSACTVFVTQALPLMDNSVKLSNIPRALEPHIRNGLLTTCQNPRHFALTFDDGPYEYTSALIDLLKKEKVKATFFINGNNYWSGSEINADLKRAYRAGFEIASHTFTHPSIPSLTDDQIKEEMYNNEQAIHKAIGKYPAVMRPPYGDVTEANVDLLNNLGYTVVKWSIDVKDWEQINTVDQELAIVKNALKDSANHNIILEHDVYKQTAKEFAPKLIKYVKSQGLRFVTMSECLGVDAYKSSGIEL